MNIEAEGVQAERSKMQETDLKVDQCKSHWKKKQSSC